MKIKSLLFTLITSLFFVQTSHTNDVFAKWTGLITKKAHDLYQNHLKNLEAPDKQIFLNLLALFNSSFVDETPADIFEILKHIEEALQASPTLLETYKQFNTDIDEILVSYTEHVKEKVSKRSIDPTFMNDFWKKFEQKMTELMKHIGNVYYKVAYKSIQHEIDEIPLTYMFDANGEIPAAERTLLLPTPSL